MIAIERALLGNFLCISGSVCSSGSVLTGNFGDLTSPNYPQNYPNNITCVWKIQSLKDRHIYLFFRDFELEEGFVRRAVSVVTFRYYEFRNLSDRKEGKNSCLFLSSMFLLHVIHRLMISSNNVLIPTYDICDVILDMENAETAGEIFEA